jgi:hypothetical protein
MEDGAPVALEILATGDVLWYRNTTRMGNAKLRAETNDVK